MADKEEIDLLERKLWEMNQLTAAVRFNHNITSNNFFIKVNRDLEMETYNYKITQMTLPHRFRMCRPQKKNLPARTEIAIEEPKINEEIPEEAGNTTSKEGQHKTRSIFK